MQRRARRSSNLQLPVLLIAFVALNTVACATVSNGEPRPPHAANSENTEGAANDVGRDEVARMESGSKGIGDMLQRFPSLRVRDHGSLVCVEFMRATSIRGVGVTQCPGQVAVVVDGVLIAGPESFLPALRPHDVERIQFLQPSAATTRYGSHGGNGALLIYTRNPGS